MKYVLLLLCFAASAFSRQRGPEPPLNITDNSSSSIFSHNYLLELGNHDATLHAIDVRLKGMDEKLGGIQTTLDKDVLPTIHVFDFIKWLFALGVAAAVGAWVNSIMKSKKQTA